jgi:hypothetical protein
MTGRALRPATRPVASVILAEPHAINSFRIMLAVSGGIQKCD